MIVDVHGHFTTAPTALDAYRGHQLRSLNKPSRGKLAISDDALLESLEPVVGQMAQRSIDAVLFSPRAAGMGHDAGDARVSRYWTETNNDLIERACRLHPNRLVPVCQLPQSPGLDPIGLLPELDRCASLGFVGCLVNPDVAGGLEPFTPSLGDRVWYPLWERLVELEMPAMIHASATRNPALHLNGSQYIAHDHAAVVELTMSSVLDDFPTLTLIIPHGGGGIPFQYNRQRALHLLQGHRPFEDALRRLYFDTSIYDADSMEMLIRKVGPANILFGSEMFGTAKAIDPETGRAFDDNLGLITTIPWLSDEDRAAIFSGNALRLFPRVRTWLDPQTVS